MGDRPSGRSSVKASHELYRGNLRQTGLSVAFDLPTQTGYDPGSIMSRGEVGKVGVPSRTWVRSRKLLDQSRAGVERLLTPARDLSDIPLGQRLPTRNRRSRLRA